MEVLAAFNANAARMAISVITLAELLHGAEKSSRPSANLAVVEDFVSRLEVLPYTAKAAQHYGQIRAALERAGEPIGVNDLHIAAHARSEGLTLVTNNAGEFRRVPALQIENWLQP
jgi:tRNA(fMet)-specific endonuclease VapC